MIDHIVLTLVSDGLRRKYKIDSHHLDQPVEAAARMMQLCQAQQSSFIEPMEVDATGVWMQNFPRSYDVVDG